MPWPARAPGAPWAKARDGAIAPLMAPAETATPWWSVAARRKERRATWNSSRISFSSAGEAPCWQPGPQICSWWGMVIENTPAVVDRCRQRQCPGEHVQAGCSCAHKNLSRLPSGAPGLDRLYAAVHSSPLMHDDPRRFSTHAFPDALRQAALNVAVQRDEHRSQWRAARPGPAAVRLAA